LISVDDFTRTSYRLRSLRRERAPPSVHWLACFSFSLSPGCAIVPEPDCACGLPAGGDATGATEVGLPDASPPCAGGAAAEALGAALPDAPPPWLVPCSGALALLHPIIPVATSNARIVIVDRFMCMDS
jgi:hypothetical protein